MEKIKLKLYEWIIFFLLLIFLIGYMGLFSLMSNYISKTIIYLVILFVWIMVLEKYIVNGIKNFKKYYFNDALSIVIVIVLVSSLLNLIFAKIDSTIPVGNSQLTDSMLAMLFSALIFAPIVEELVNRCAIGLFLEKFIKNDVVINVVTAIIFAFLHLFKMHLNIYGLIFYGLVYGMLGYSCGYYYRKTSNIVLSMLIHFIWNLCMFAGIVLRNMLWMKTSNIVVDNTDNTSAIENMNEFYLSYKESQNAYAEYQQEVDDWKKSNDNAETPIQPILL